MYVTFPCLDEADTPKQLSPTADSKCLLHCTMRMQVARQGLGAQGGAVASQAVSIPNGQEPAAEPCMAYCNL
jgi:hypothetical protein